MIHPKPVRRTAIESFASGLWIARLALLLVTSGLLISPAFSQAEHPVTGRKIAPTMGMSGAGWLERSERETEEHPEEALDAMALKPGMVVADVGAGVGYLTIRLARRVGPSGKVYANDIQPAMLSRLQERLDTEHISNVETVLGTQSDPKLPAGELDVILMVDVYHELSQPRRMLDEMRKALKPDGRLIVIEYRKEDPAIPIRPEHKMSAVEVKTEVEAEGYRLLEVLRTLPRQSIFIFRKQLPS